VIDWVAAMLLVLASLFYTPRTDSDLRPIDCTWVQGDWQCRI
jgi:hypothetical protein